MKIKGVESWRPQKPRKVTWTKAWVATVTDLSELKSPSLYKDLAAEAMLSTCLLFIVNFSTTTFNPDIYFPTTTHIGLMAGFTIYLLVEGFAHISGANMNPAISYAQMLVGRISAIRGKLLNPTVIKIKNSF